MRTADLYLRASELRRVAAAEGACAYGPTTNRADGDAVGWSILTGLAASFPAAERWRMPIGFSAFEEEILDDLIEDLGALALGE